MLSDAVIQKKFTVKKFAPAKDYKTETKYFQNLNYLDLSYPAPRLSVLWFKNIRHENST